jgi:hypothetical protein
MVLEIYNNKLNKRLERRKFVFERGFLEFKKVYSRLLSASWTALKAIDVVENSHLVLCRLVMSHGAVEPSRGQETVSKGKGDTRQCAGFCTTSDAGRL